MMDNAPEMYAEGLGTVVEKPLDHTDDDADAVCQTGSGCSCSPAGGTCVVCRRTHRIAYGIVAIMAALTLCAQAVSLYMSSR